MGSSTAGERLDPELTWLGVVTHSLAALAVSGLGLGVAMGVGMLSAAQSTTYATSTAVGGVDRTRAVPDRSVAELDLVPSPGFRLEPDSAAGTGSGDGTGGDAGTGDGSSMLPGDDAFRHSSGAQNSAVGSAIDVIIAQLGADERGTGMSVTADAAQQSAQLAITDARSTELVDQTTAIKREQVRLAEEKKKAEEALARTQAQARAPQLAPPPADQGLVLPSTPPPGTVGQATTPLAPRAYTVGARWGAVGAWSRYHTGQDLGAPIGAPVRSVAAGVVMTPNAGGWAGTHVIVRHSDGSSSLYAHLSASAVRPGQLVATGQAIGTVGMTGRTFGPHLHLEHYPAGASTTNPYVTDDPYAWLLRQGVRL